MRVGEVEALGVLYGTQPRRASLQLSCQTDDVPRRPTKLRQDTFLNLLNIFKNAYSKLL